MELAPITGRIELDDHSAVEAERRVADGARKMQAAVEKESRSAAKAMENNFKSSLKNINAEFGKKSVGGQVLRLAAGGGAIAGIGLAAHEWDAFTGSIQKS